MDNKKLSLMDDLVLDNQRLCAENAALKAMVKKFTSTNTTNYAIGLCAKKVMVTCAEFDPASGNCQRCDIRPTA